MHQWLDPWQREVAASLRVNQAILRASNEDKTLDLKEVGKFRRVEFPHTDGVTLLLSLSQQFPNP